MGLLDTLTKIVGGAASAIPGIGPFLGPLINAGGTVAGGVSSQNQQQWLQQALVNILNNSREAQGTGLQRVYDSFNPARDQSLELLARGGQFSFGNDGAPGAFTGLNEDLLKAYGQMDPSAFRNYNLSPDTQQNIQSQQGLAGGMGNVQDVLNTIVSRLGQSQDTMGLRDMLSQIAYGQGAQIGGMGNKGLDLLGSGGQTAFTQNLQNNAGSVLGANGMTPEMGAGIQRALQLMGGGRTPGMDALFNRGQADNNLGVAGLTSTGAQGELTALQGLQTGGKTPLTDQYSQFGADVGTHNPLMPTDMAVAMGRDQAVSTVMRNARQAYQNALNRGMGPGIVGSGGASELMSDFGDEAASAEAQAIRDTMFKQQGLGLQEQQYAGQLGLGAGGLETDRLQKFSSLLSSLEGVAAGRYGAGGGMMSDAEKLALQQMGIGADTIAALENAGTQRSNVFGNLGLGAAGQELSSMGLGGNLLNQFNQLRLGGTGQLNNLIGTQNQYTLGAASQLPGITNSQAGIYGNIGNQIQGAQGLNTQSTQDYYNALSQLLGQRGQVAGQGLNLITAGMNPLLSMGQDWTRYATQGLQSQGGLFSGYQPQNPYSTVFSNAAGANIGGIFTPSAPKVQGTRPGDLGQPGIGLGGIYP